MRRLPLGAVIVLGLASVAFAQASNRPAAAPNASDSLAEVKRAIDKGNGQWVEGWEKGDPDLVAAVFAEDAVWLADKGQVVRGRRAIAERLRGWMKSVGRDVKVTVTTVDVWLDGGTAFETGKYFYEYRREGKSLTDQGRYVTMWRRQADGSWKLAMDMGVPTE